MTGTGHIPVMMAAMAVSLSAKIGEFDQEQTDRMVTSADELLDHAAPLFRAICGFATQAQMVRRDPAALAMQGRILAEAVERAAGAAPALPSFRADIDG